MRRRPAHVMFQGTGANAGKTVFTRSMCRWASNTGYTVAPFKAVTVGSNFETHNGLELDFRMWLLGAAARATVSQLNSPITVRRMGRAGRVFCRGRPLGDVELLAEDTPLLWQLSVDAQTVVRNTIADSIQRLSRENDFLVIEGAGAAAELGMDDLANVFVASVAAPRTVLVSCASAGGSLAAVEGNWRSYPARLKKNVCGFVLNDVLAEDRFLSSRAKQYSDKLGIAWLGNLPHCEIYDDIPPGEHSSLADDEAEYDYLAAQLEANVAIEQMLFPPK